MIRLPEQYNWYFDRQKRIGGRLAVFAELDVGGQPVGAVSIHLENRTHGEGRRAQMAAILEAVRKELPHMPLILGGDLNTNTFDGRSKEDVGAIAADPALRRRCLEDVGSFEPLLPLCAADGYEIVPKEPRLTRRKPLPNGDSLPLRLDWILLKDAAVSESRIISTAKEDLTYAKPWLRSGTFSGGRAVGPQCRLGHVPPSLIFFCKSELFFPRKKLVSSCKKLRVQGHGAFYVAESLAYFSSTLPPASSICFFRASASSLLTASFRVEGAPSTVALASARPWPVISRTTLMTLILAAASKPARTTSKSVFSSAAGAAAPAAGAAIAAAETPNSSSRA